MFNNKYTIISLKSFGDLTIAVKSLKMLFDEDAQFVKLVVGNYHYELVKALQPMRSIEFVDLKNKEVPAFYNLKKKGVMLAVLSMIEVYRALNTYRQGKERLIFDSLKIRERILAFGGDKIGLVDGPNIYANYRRTFLEIFGRTKDDYVVAGRGENILICPHASQSFRTLPADLIDQLSIKCVNNGFNPVIYMINGEEPISCRVPQVIFARRSFSDLRYNIEKVCAVISADSLGAHMSAYVSRPVFVATPCEKTNFWLPPNTYENQYWGLFSDSKKMIFNLEKFLISLK